MEIPQDDNKDNKITPKKKDSTEYKYDPNKKKVIARNKKATKNFSQGVYHVNNLPKYMGTKMPFYRSSWELTFCRYCDSCDAIVKWGSELVKVPYFDSVRGRKRYYYTDFVVIFKRGDEAVTQLIEIKPWRETVDPNRLSLYEGNKTKTGKPKKKQKSTILYEQQTWETNSCKWAAARAMCNENGWEFKVLTEYELGRKKKK